MTAALVAIAGLVGLVLGSFANVSIHRWPRGGTVAQPRRSACPACAAEITWWDNLPVLSWLLLRGRCRHCGARISMRYPIVEAATGMLFVATAWVWGPTVLLPALLVLVWSLVVASVIDLEHHIIPNRLTFRLAPILLPLLAAAAWIEGAWGDLLRGVIAAIGVPAVMWGLSELFRLLRGKQGFGMGDVKLAVSIGLVVGYLGGLHLVVFAYASIIAAVAVAVGLMVAGRARLASRIPFGPYLAVGALVAVLAGDATTALVGRLLGL